jgi:hypothetical protein
MNNTPFFTTIKHGQFGSFYATNRVSVEIQEGSYDVVCVYDRSGNLIRFTFDQGGLTISDLAYVANVAVRLCDDAKGKPSYFQNNSLLELWLKNYGLWDVEYICVGKGYDKQLWSHEDARSF